jgi:hypothetical protein
MSSYAKEQLYLSLKRRMTNKVACGQIVTDEENKALVNAHFDYLEVSNRIKEPGAKGLMEVIKIFQAELAESAALIHGAFSSTE